jgi:hypothetical protein
MTPSPGRVNALTALYTAGTTPGERQIHSLCGCQP